jgi:hypothetical protein
MDQNSAASPQHAAARVKTPALALMVMSCLGIVIMSLALILQVVGLMTGTEIEIFSWGNPSTRAAFRIGIAIVAVLANGVIFAGAMKMRNLTGYGLAKTAAILAIVPCVGPCCVLTVPLGIWAFMVLSDQQVRSAFR